MVAGALSKFKKKKSHWIPRDETIYQEKKKKIQEKKQASVCGVKTQNRSLKHGTY